MEIKVSEFVDVNKRLEELGCKYPISGLALLPVNLETARNAEELMQAAEAATIRKLLLAENLPISDVTSSDRRLPSIKNKSFEWIAPILYVPHELYRQNPELVSIIIKVISHYAHEFFKGKTGTHTVQFNLVSEETKDKITRKVSYSGPVEGLKELPPAIKEALK